MKEFNKALRCKAEKMVNENLSALMPDQEIGFKTVEENEITFHELLVYKFELEMQNLELRKTQANLEIAKARYFEIFEMAPLSYVIVSADGIIIETNLISEELFGAERRFLIGKEFSQFILNEDQDIYYFHRRNLFETLSPQESELRMVKRDGAVLRVILNSDIVQNVDGLKICQSLITDITNNKAV